MMAKGMARALAVALACASLVAMTNPQAARAKSPRTERERPTPEAGATVTPTVVPTPTPKPTPYPTRPSLWEETLSSEKAKESLEAIRLNNGELAKLRSLYSAAHRAAQNRLDAIRRGAVTDEIVNKANNDLKEMKMQAAKVKVASDEVRKYQNEARDLLDKREENKAGTWVAAIKNQRDKQAELIRYIREAIELVEQIGREA